MLEHLFLPPVRQRGEGIHKGVETEGKVYTLSSKLRQKMQRYKKMTKERKRMKPCNAEPRCSIRNEVRRKKRGRCRVERG